MKWKWKSGGKIKNCMATTTSTTCTTSTTTSPVVGSEVYTAKSGCFLATTGWLPGDVPTSRQVELDRPPVHAVRCAVGCVVGVFLVWGVARSVRLYVGCWGFCLTHQVGHSSMFGAFTQYGAGLCFLLPVDLQEMFDPCLCFSTCRYVPINMEH